MAPRPFSGQPPLPAEAPPSIPQADAATAAAYANYGYGPRHPMHQQSQAAQAALSALASGSQYYQQASAYQQAGPSTYGASAQTHGASGVVQSAAPTLYDQSGAYGHGAASPMQGGPPAKRARYDQAMIGPSQPMGGSASPTAYNGFSSPVGSSYGGVGPRQPASMPRSAGSPPLGMPPPTYHSRAGYGMPSGPRGGRGGYAGPPGPNYRAGGPNGDFRGGPPMNNGNYRGGGPMPGRAAGSGYGSRPPPAFNQRAGGQSMRGPPNPPGRGRGSGSRSNGGPFGYGPTGSGRGRAWTARGSASARDVVDPRRATEDKRRSRTDFRIKGIEIAALGWSWDEASAAAREVKPALNGHAEKPVDHAEEPASKEEDGVVGNGGSASREPAEEDVDEMATQLEVNDDEKAAAVNIEAEIDQLLKDGAEAAATAIEGDEPVELTSSGPIKRPASPVKPARPARVATPVVRKSSEVRIHFMTGPPPAIPTPSSSSASRKRARSELSASVEPAAASANSTPATEDATEAPMEIEPSGDADGEPIEVDGEQIEVDGERTGAAKQEETKVDEQPDATIEPTTATEPEAKPVEAEKAPEPSSAPSDERLTVIFDDNAYRLHIDSSVVGQIRLHRADLRLEIDLQLAAAPNDASRPLQGFLIERRDAEINAFAPVTVEALSSADETILPPLHRLVEHAANDVSPVIVLQLDRASPLNESKWAVNGEVDAWIKSQAAITGGAASSWLGKILVVDPDELALDAWIESSVVGSAADRKAFVEMRLATCELRMEILLRLVRGDLLNDHPGFPPPQPQSAAVAAQAVQLGAPYRSHQTPISLATFSLFRLAYEMAQQAGLGREAIDKRVDEILHMLPYGLIFRAIDSLLRQAQAEEGF